MAENKNKLIIPVWHSGAYPPEEVEINLGDMQRIPSGNRNLRGDGGMQKTPMSAVVEELIIKLEKKGIFGDSDLPLLQTAMEERGFGKYVAAFVRPLSQYQHQY